MDKLTIELTQGFQAIVSQEDYDYLKQFKWCAVKPGKMVYAFRNGKVLHGIKSPGFYMHKEVAKRMGLDTTQMVDHKNKNPLDNRRINLRNTTKSENASNNSASHVARCNTPQGVRFRAQVIRNGVKVFDKQFIDCLDAYDAVKTFKNGGDRC